MTSLIRSLATAVKPKVFQKGSQSDTSEIRRISDQSRANYFASFPEESQLQEVYDDAFVINKPMAGVGGDGYWHCTKGSKSILILFDCMGHGRFAAMMTRLYVRIIYEVVMTEDHIEPDKILKRVDEKVQEEFKSQDLRSVQCGADLGVLVFDRKVRVATYGGAKTDLLIMKERSYERIKGDRLQVGATHKKNDDGFTVHQIKLGSDRKVRFYLYSDGVTDLFGGPKNKKLGFDHLVEIIKDSQTRFFSEEKNGIIKALDRWLGSEEPLDDMLMIGLVLD